MSDNKQNQKPKQNQRLNTYAKYSGIVFQMAAIIGIGTYGGMKLDEKFKREFPLFTLILSLLSVFIALYIVIKQVMNEKD